MLSNRRSMLNVPTAPITKPSRPRSAYAPGALPPLTGLDDPTTEPHCRTPSVPTSTTPYLPGYRTVKLIGTVYGMATCARKDSKSFLKSVGNAQEAKGLTHMLYNARDQATERMVMDCITRGGNAIIGMGFGESEILGFAQISVSGTAVYVERDQPSGTFEAQ
ncbi:hypothetical protein JX265_003272 [Neoarthrinium moseri]|uniref:DUF74-domain-containing protein n=1 Tax=Neoarthrinium moseri TaxID=1658444 RepID=A0A9P9WUA5_9PEZI|nr:uncharacterized protein JN550_005488 [Neoarthrinium moseri]KAI1852786.1 hypothetical protein JX266_002327 [Neoarthrinium moseri]KAI1869898.1 hypothetical protein JN550_005488 [Neoarthrinium moseri]KAI1879095.1 hypothetical protein JX265_003272 [Neoarthrinium moseri]